VYTWIATGTAAWGTAINWSPARTSPATDDVLQFTGGGAVTATGITSQTIGRLAVANGTVVTLTASALSTLTIAGTDGADLDVASGSGLRLTGASAITVALGAAATGSVAGSVDLLGAAHKIAALGANALELQSGAVITCGTGFSSYPFGGGSGTSAPGSVVFHAGALLAQSAGLSPFGTSTPPVVTFEHGSRYRVDAASVAPSLGGRTYADFEQNNTGSVTPGGSGAFTVDSVIVTRGTLNLPMAGTIRGDVTVKSGATLNLNPSSPAIVTLGGAGTQTITPAGGLNANVNTTLQLANASGFILGNSLTLGGALQFTSGRLTTGAYVLGVTGAISGASQTDGYIDGNLQLTFPAGDSTRVFDIGDASTYTPVTIAMYGAASPFNLLAVTHTPDHPQLATSGLEPAKSVNRYWTVTPSGLPTYSGFDATFSYRANNLDANAEPAIFVVKRYASGAWFATTTGARTATSTQAVGVTDFGDFAVADPPSYALTLATSGPGSATYAPNQKQFLPGSSVQLTAVPDAGATFAGWSGDASGSTNPLTVTMTSDKSITANFNGTMYTLTVTTTGNGAVAKSPDQPSYAAGSQVQLTATPAAHWYFDRWSGDDTSSINPLTLTMDANKSLNAAFFADSFTVTTNVTGNGHVLRNPDQSKYAYGSALTVIAVPDSGWHWGAWSGDTTSAAMQFTTPVTSARTYTATFTEFTGVGRPPVQALDLSVPNPIRASATIRLALPLAGRVRLRVIDLSGREVAEPLDAEVPAGRLDVRHDTGARGLAPGLYFARLEAPGGMLTRRFVVTR